MSTSTFDDRDRAISAATYREFLRSHEAEFRRIAEDSQHRLNFWMLQDIGVEALEQGLADGLLPQYVRAEDLDEPGDS